MNISKIQTLIDTAKFEEAIVAVDNLTHNQLEGQLYKSVVNVLLGNLQLADKLAKESLQEAINSKNLELEFASRTAITNVKAWRSDPDVQDALDKAYDLLEKLRERKQYKSTYWVGLLHLVEGWEQFFFTAKNTEQFQEYTTRAQTIIDELNWKYFEYFLRLLQYGPTVLSGNLDQGIPQLQLLIEEISIKGYRVLEGFANTGICAIHLIRGDFEKFKEFIFKAGKIWREVKYPMGETYCQGGMGVYYLNVANLEEAFQCFQQSLMISNQIDTKLNLGSTYRFLGEINYRRGELKEALVSYQKSLKIHQKHNDVHGMGDSHSHIGKIYQEFGDLDFALENYQKGLEKRQSIEYLSGIAASYDLLGNLHLEKNELKSANEYYLIGLKIKRGLGNEFSIATTLFNQIRINLVLEPMMVTSLFAKLETINNKLDNKQVDLYTKLAKALILKNSTRGLKKSQAHLILLEISQMKIVDHRLSVLALLNLTEILLWELKSSGDKEVLNEIDETISKLIAIAETQNIPSLFVRTYLFRSKLALLNLKVDKAKEHLNKAQEIATNQGLRHLAILVSNELDMLLNQIDKWEDLVERKLPFDQVIELTQFEQILKRINPQENQEATAEEPVLLLILGVGGVTLFSHKFSEVNIKEGIVGSFLNAINTFGKETFSHEGSIERIVHQNYTILIKSMNNLLFCYIIKGNSYSAIQKIDTFIESVQASAIWYELVGSKSKLEKEFFVTLERICCDLFIYNDTFVENSQVDEISASIPSNNTEYLEVPKELLSYKFLLNPVRLFIIKILNNYFRYPAADLRKLLGIPWGTFNDHLEALSKKGFIESQKEFIEESPRNIIFLTSSGASEYSMLKSILHSVIA